MAMTSVSGSRMEAGSISCLRWRHRELIGVRARLFRQQRVCDAELRESLGAQQARVASPARRAILRGVVAAAGERVVDAELDAAAEDAGLGELDERRVDLQPRSLDAGPGRELRHL